MPNLFLIKILLKKKICKFHKQTHCNEISNIKYEHTGISNIKYERTEL